MPNNNVLTERQRMDLLLVADDMEVSGDAKLGDALRALLAAHPGQPEPRAEVTDGRPLCCSSDPTSCPDNEGTGCWCSDAARAGASS